MKKDILTNYVAKERDVLKKRFLNKFSSIYGKYSEDNEVTKYLEYLISKQLDYYCNPDNLVSQELQLFDPFHEDFDEQKAINYLGQAIKEACVRDNAKLAKSYSPYIHTDRIKDTMASKAEQEVRTIFGFMKDTVITAQALTDLLKNQYINANVFRNAKLVERGESFREVIKEYGEVDTTVFLYYLHLRSENDQLSDLQIAEKIIKDNSLTSVKKTASLTTKAILGLITKMKTELKNSLHTY